MNHVAGDFTQVGRSEIAPPLPLREVDDFGSNPGDLRMFIFEPRCRSRKCPAVLVLHGCTQTAAGFDRASGWSKLAEEHGFMLVYAEQKRRNNDQGCFSWFQPADTTRGCGEVESLRQMVNYAEVELSADRDAMFVCGLSAGGAMAAAVLATYPELFNAGAIIAGLPFGAASSASEAFDVMFVGRTKEAHRWGDLVRAAAPSAKVWPRVSIWHGTADPVVRPINAGELVKQWINVHGIGAETPATDLVGPATRRTWHALDGRACVTEYSVPGLAHGVPTDAVEPPAPFFLPSGMSATRQIAEDFGLLSQKPSRLSSPLGLHA